MLGARVVRVKLWTRDGRIVYSDEPRLIGARFPLDAEKLDVLRTGTTKASLSDLAGPENRYERGQGDLYEVYLPIRAPDGTPLLFETYQRRSAVASTGRRIWMPFAALLLGSLVVLWVVQVPLASRLDRRLRRTQAEREALLVRAVEASDDERRRIAAELHDGPVQDLAGISYSLSAAAQTESSSVARETLQHAAAGTRDSMRQLRSLLVDIHPPNLRASGLEAALADLLAPLQARGAEIELTVGPALALDEDAERTVYRAAAEALRNVQRHAAAHRVTVSVERDDAGVRLEVTDDGAGFAPDDRERRREEGHVGLSLLEELAARTDGRLDVRSAPGEGTTFATRTSARMIRLLIADDHAVVRTGLERLVTTFEDVELVGAAANGQEAVERCLESEPDVVLMDLEMPVLDGIAATRAIAATQPDVAVVVLTSFSDRDQILRALDAGAVGYLLKDAEPEEIAKALRAAARGEAPLDPRAGRALLSARSSATPLDGLSEREQDVLRLVARGLPNKLIARELSISEKTVKAHLTQVFRVIGVTDRTQAALWAERTRRLGEVVGPSSDCSPPGPAAPSGHAGARPPPLPVDRAHGASRHARGADRRGRGRRRRLARGGARCHRMRLGDARRTPSS